MKSISHQSAKPTHYNKEAQFYDSFNEENSQTINRTIEKILRKHRAKSVIDLTCGTGSQVFWLTRRGFSVLGSDINTKMLAVAKAKAIEDGLTVKLEKADMRNAQFGKFDAAITIFNAIGHLTKADFIGAIKNIRSNLNDGGLYVFDIFNSEFLHDKDNITKFTIDWLTRVDNTIARVIQYSTIDKRNIMVSFTTHIERKGNGVMKKVESAQTLQTYSAQQLQALLEKSGFDVITQCAIDGSAFHNTKTERIFTVAKKRITK